MPQTDRRRRARDGVGDRLHDLGRLRRRRHVDGFFEERPVERFGLVEHREHVERSAIEQSLERKLAARNELLDEHDAMSGVALRLDVGRAQQRLQTREGASKCRRIVDAHDPAAARQGGRLDYRRERHLAHQRSRRGVH